MLYKVIKNDYVYWYKTKDLRDRAVKAYEGVDSAYPEIQTNALSMNAEMIVECVGNKVIKCVYTVEDVIDTYMRLKQEDVVEIE